MAQDLKTAGLTAERLKEAQEGGAATGARKPLPFESREQYEQFMSEFSDVMKGVTVDGKPVTAQSQVLGTSSQFYSGNPDKAVGHFFDREQAAGKPSDVDIDLQSPEMTRRMLTLDDPAVNKKAMIDGKYTLFKSGGEGGLYSQFPELRNFALRWGDILGREVDIKLKMDLTPINEIKASESGPIEFYRKDTK